MADRSYRPLPQGDTSDEEELSNVYSPGTQDDEIIVVFDKPKQDHTSKSTTSISLIQRPTHVVTCVILIIMTILLVTLIGYGIHYYIIWGNINEVESPPPEFTSSTSSSLVFSSSSSSLLSRHPLSPSPSLVASNWKSSSWRFNIIGGTSELSPHLHDANGDGILDIFVTNITNKFNSPGYYGCHGDTNKCFETYGHSPCQVHILALSGQDGSIVWEKWVEYNIYAANCREDLNSDGHKDCLFAGRVGTFVAIDTYNDALLWVVDSNVSCPSFNYYYPLFVDDFDEDGTRDVIIINGGDSMYVDEEKERSPAVLLVISGRTGRQISDRIHTPDQKESYSSPVLYKLPNTDIKLVLFGSGGETISGSLWAIDMASLADHVTLFLSKKAHVKYEPNKVYVHPSCLSEQELLATRPRGHNGLYSNDKKEKWMKRCPLWSKSTQPIWNKYKICVYNFIPSGVNGVLIPPVIVDINNDNSMDLVVSLFNDHTLLFDGSLKKFAWDHQQPETQTYSIPSPLYFNDDNVLDLVVRYNKGKLMQYDYSFVGIINGKSGTLITKLLTCNRGNMVSPIVLRHREKGQDGFLIAGTDCNGLNSHNNKRNTPLKGVCPSNRIKFERGVCPAARNKRHYEGEAEEENNTFLDKLPQQEQYLESLNFNLTGYIPTDIWDMRNNSDSYPNPWTNTESFIRDYCGYDVVSTSVYFITQQLAMEPLRPLIVYKPYVYKPPSYSHRAKDKRHLKQPTNDEMIEEVKNQFTDRKAVRCSHILIPLYSSQSFAITDFDGDGLLEGVVSMSYSPIDSLLSVPQLSDQLHPPKVIIDVFSIKEKVKEVYGPLKVNFSGFYSIDDQPWAQYMGTNGDGFYDDPQLL